MIYIVYEYSFESDCKPLNLISGSFVKNNGLSYLVRRDKLLSPQVFKIV